MADKDEPQVQLAIRVSESVLNRVDRLAEKLSQPGIRVTRTDVLRLMIYQGVERLETEQKKR